LPGAGAGGQQDQRAVTADRLAAGPAVEQPLELRDDPRARPHEQLGARQPVEEALDHHGSIQAAATNGVYGINPADRPEKPRGHLTDVLSALRPGLLRPSPADAPQRDDHPGPRDPQ